MAEFEAVLAADRKRAPKTDPLREQIRALRQELLTFHVLPDPADDLDQFMFEEAYAASDFSSAGGDDDRGWGAEDDIADGWSQGGRQSGHSGTSCVVRCVSCACACRVVSCRVRLG
jgi:hypothetical protein